jgi:hypothetical protein
MSYRKGTVVQYKVGKGKSIGKIVKVVDGMAEIRTKNGVTVTRNVAGLSEPGAAKEEDESSTPGSKRRGGGPRGQLVPNDNDEDGETQLSLFTGDEEE